MDIATINVRNKIMKKILFKIFGGIVGFLFIVFGIHLFLNPLFDNALEKINSIVFLVLGGFFIKYAVTSNKQKEE